MKKTKSSTVMSLLKLYLSNKWKKLCRPKRKWRCSMLFDAVRCCCLSGIMDIKMVNKVEWWWSSCWWWWWINHRWCLKKTIFLIFIFFWLVKLKSFDRLIGVRLTKSNRKSKKIKTATKTTPTCIGCRNWFRIFFFFVVVVNFVVRIRNWLWICSNHDTIWWWLWWWSTTTKLNYWHH